MTGRGRRARLAASGGPAIVMVLGIAGVAYADVGVAAFSPPSADPGDTVTFITHVKNKGLVRSKWYRYAWLIDGREVKASDYAFSSMVMAVVQSDPFRMKMIGNRE